jgi:hypothetical protein
VQGRDKAGSLEFVGKVLAAAREQHADDDSLDELGAGRLGRDDEALGTPDADELVLAEIGDGPEEVGLDTESGADEQADVGALELLDLEEDDGARAALDDALPDLADDFAQDEDEQSWTEDSEGFGGSWEEDDLELDDEAESSDDGGLEGVDDPLLERLEIDEDAS